MLPLLAIALMSSVGATTVSYPSEQCERAPPHAQPADANYRITVAGDPDLFLAGELYTVSLQGVDSGQGPTPFVGFTIWAELDEGKDGENPQSEESSDQKLGSFQTYDAQIKLREVCKPAVENATAHPKTEIQVIWSAPLKAVDVCIRLCAKASSIDEKKTVSFLARKLCAAPAASANFARQPHIVEPCCACDEAKYEVTFESMWSRNTHPRDFPPESSRAHFGDVIGASHTAQFRVWQEGRAASQGLRRLAEDGVTTALEKELKAESDHIRTIIKARGINWQQIAGGTGHPSTFAVFRVDPKHHLVSMASKLAPSPDWFVGVSALELCNANCTWSQNVTLALYPFDAGTDSGLSYVDTRQPTIPPAPVRALRPDWPRDVRSPFFSNTGEMRPFAQLRFNRLRLYEKNCDASETASNRGMEQNVGPCAVHTWGAWGPCSVTCGPGRATRQRHYVWPAKARNEGCNLQLTDYKNCHGPRRHCRAVSEYEPDPAESTGPCAVSEWSEWSPCEGCGVRARTRHYLAPRAHKRCHVGYRARMVMSQAIPCEAGPCHRPPEAPENSTNFDWFFVDSPRGECPVSKWGEWSPCSAKCGRGRRIRTRLYISRDSRVQQELTRRLMKLWNNRFAELQNLEVKEENVTSEDPEVDKLVQEHLDRCQYTLSQQEALCDGPDTGCVTAMGDEVCKLPISVGHCRGYEERWFYDSTSGVCEPFGYTGCGGNANNFRTQNDCKRACAASNDTTTTTTTSTTTVSTTESTSEPTTKKLKTTPVPVDNEVMLHDSPKTEENINCEVGPWLGWTSCFGDCGYGIKLNYRLVTRPAARAGKPCPRVVKSGNCRVPHCRHSTVTNHIPKGHH